MDSRVEILGEELQSLPKEQNFDPTVYIARIRRLHSEIDSEQDRVTLLGLRKVLLDLCERQVAQQNGNIELLRNARRAEDRLLCIQEASTNGRINPEILAKIVDREIDACRIDDPDFLSFASSGAAIFGDGQPSERPGLRWIKKLFGRK